MSQIKRRNRRLADIGVDVSGQAAESGLDRIDGFRHAGEIGALDHLFDQTQLFVGGARIDIPDRNGSSDKGFSDLIRAQFLKGRISIDRLIVRIGIKKSRRLVGHHLFQYRRDRLALGKPLTPDFCEEPCRVGLIEHDGPGRPAIWGTSSGSDRPEFQAS